MMYAHYYKSTKGAIVTITTSPKPVGGTTYAVSGIAEARKLAAAANAKPWNF